MFWPCESRTSTCRNFATISSGLYRFLAKSSLMSKTYLKSDHFNGGGSGLHRTIGRAGGRLSETRSPGRGHRQSDLARRKGRDDAGEPGQLVRLLGIKS